MEEKVTTAYENELIWFGAAVSIAEILTGTYFASLEGIVSDFDRASDWWYCDVYGGDHRRGPQKKFDGNRTNEFRTTRRNGFCRGEYCTVNRMDSYHDI